MEFHTLSRKELQTLCKSHGIPANKSNQFMAEALAKKRVPLSTQDANRGPKNDAATGNLKKSDDRLARDQLKAQKDVKYANNFLTRGRRKDGSAVPSSLDSTTLANGRPVDKRVISKAESIKAASQEKENVERQCGVLPSSNVDLTRAEKNIFADKMRSQIEASLRTKVANAAPMRLPEPLLQRSCEGTAAVSNSKGTVKADVKGGGGYDGLKFSVEGNDEQQKRNVPSPTRFPSGFEMMVTSTSPSAPNDGEEQTQRCPSPLSCPLEVILEKNDTLSSSDSGHRKAVDLIASPPLRFSPLQRIEQNILSILNRAKNFWGKPGSPVS